MHLPWKGNCLLQLRAAGSAKAKGNVTGQWLSGKQYNAISTSASQCDLFCPMTHMGKAGSLRSSQGLAPKPCGFHTPASAIHMVTLCVYPLFCAPVLSHYGNCHTRGCPMAPIEYEERLKMSPDKTFSPYKDNESTVLQEAYGE